ncbi:hypothetical protein P38_0622 [Pseudomonas aeruginosa MH38]|nr:hypothetical protein P38_0622 [Pseudomonas aeruginosa MH38]
MQTLRPAHSFCRRPASGTAASYRESLPCREIRTRHFRAEERRSPNRRRASVMFHPFGRRASGTPGRLSMADLADHANELVLARLDGLLAARPALAIRESAEDCEDCGEPIPQARRRAAPGCSRCIDCQDRHERR